MYNKMKINGLTYEWNAENDAKVFVSKINKTRESDEGILSP